MCRGCMSEGERIPTPPAEKRRGAGNPRKRQYASQGLATNARHLCEQRSRIEADLKLLQENKSKMVQARNQNKPSASSQGPLKGVHKETKEIRFYDTYGKYGQFTNFFPCLTDIDGYTWKTTEHYFQANKFIGTPYYDYIRSLKTAREAFQFSREQRVRPWIRFDWHHIKEAVMRKALLHKFTQNEALKKVLLDTGNKVLIEHTKNDSYWGNGGDDSGQNRLGKLLMVVREDIRKKDQAQPQTHPLRRRSSSLRRSSSIESLHTSGSKRNFGEESRITSPHPNFMTKEQPQHRLHHPARGNLIGSPKDKLPPIEPQWPRRK